MTKKTAGWTRTAGGAATLLLALGLLGCDEERNKFVAPPPSKVGVALPLRKAVTPYLELTGTAAAYASVNLVARVEGYLKSINYVDGSIAKTGELLFEIDPVPYQVQVEQAKAAVASAQASLVFAQKELQRQSALLTEDVNTQAQTDKARANRDSDQANVEGQEASLHNAQINLSYTRIEAPFPGIVTRHLASVGELVGTGGHTNLASIVQIDPIYVMFNVSDQDLMKFRANQGDRRLTLQEIQQLPIEVGLMSETGFPHVGKGNYVSPELDPQTATILMRGVFENKNGALLPGMFVRVRMPLGPPVANALLVPDRILQQSQEGRYVLVVGPNDEVEQRVVQLGEIDGGLRVITAGLKPDDRVVVSGADRAVPGRKVAPQLVSLPALTERTAANK